jgi:uncharacterized protein (UPF0212 family)
MVEQNTNTNPENNWSSSIQDHSNYSTQEDNLDSSDQKSTTDRHIIVFSIGWVVRGAKTGQEAINIAVSEVGKRVELSGDQVRTVDISVQRIECGRCRISSDALLLVSETALVGLLLQTEVDATDSETAEKIARREVGSHLHSTRLITVSITPVD